MKQGFLALTGIRPASTRQQNGKVRRSAAATSGYEPISSVWEGTDGELLEAMFEFYATIDPDPILDATYNSGRFWKDSERRVVSMDIDARHKPMIVGDNRKMAGVPSAHFGTVVYDPPHVARRAGIRVGKNSTWTLERRSSVARNRIGTSAICIRRFCSKPSES